MRKLRVQAMVFLAAVMVAIRAGAGTISYVAIPATDSDANSGISTGNVYTCAVNGGNTSGTDMVVNGVTLNALVASGSGVAANNMVLNALTGTLTNADGTLGIEADGVLGQALASMTYNQDAEDGSQQEIALDPASLTAGKTYDMRLYFCNSSGQNRTVDLSFAGDGQTPVDTGTFNEDDATTCGGGFTDQNQVYYIDYRYTWDGDTTPGVTITQSAGSVPFCLYILTNQEASGNVDLTAPATSPGTEEGGAPAAVATAQQVDAAAQSDTGAESDDFYQCDGLNQNGTWVNVAGYGMCWQPSGRPPDWCPYTHGHWAYSPGYGYTWISDSSEEDWGWACYHYGRWARCGERGWCWCPGRVWAPAWVSWRMGDPASGCIGWAPLPPECRISVGIGVSTWVDNQYGIGPGYYNFCRVRDLGSENLSRAVYSRQQTINIFNRTTNITNITYNRTSNTFYTGGPNYQTVNTLIAKGGGKPVQSVVINRKQTTAPFAGGKRSQMQGNVLTLAAPNVIPSKKVTAKPTPAATVAAAQVDHGWKAVTDPKVAKALKTRIATEAAGKTPNNTHAKLPPEAAKAGLTHPVGPGALHPGAKAKLNAGTNPLTPGVKLKKAGPPPGKPQSPPKLTLHPGISIKQAGAPGPQTGKPTESPELLKLHPGGKPATSPGKGAKKPTPTPAKSETAGAAASPSPRHGKTKKPKEVTEPTPPLAAEDATPEAVKTQPEVTGQPTPPDAVKHRPKSTPSPKPKARKSPEPHPHPSASDEKPRKPKSSPTPESQ